MNPLDVLDALARHFEERRADVLAWPWGFFCAQWARMLGEVERRRRTERQREQQRAHDKAARELAKALDEG